MTTKRSFSSAKILRLGIVHGDKVIGEKLIENPQPIFVGDSPLCTLCLPASSLVTYKRLLLDYREGQYFLDISFLSDCKITPSVKQSQVSLSLLDLKSKTQLIKHESRTEWPIEEETRGSLQLGDVSILFQFVPSVNANNDISILAFKGGLLQSIDWGFALDLAVVSVLFLGFHFYLRTVQVPERISLEEVSDRFARLVVPDATQLRKNKQVSIQKEERVTIKPVKPKPKPVEVPKEEDKPTDTTARQTETQESGMETAKETKISDAQRAQIRQQVMKSGVLAVLGSVGDKKSGTMALQEVFDEHKPSIALEQGFKSAHQESLVANSQLAIPDALDASDNMVHAEGLKPAIGTKNTKKEALKLTEKKETSVGSPAPNSVLNSSVQTRAPEVDSGNLEPAVIANVVRNRLGSVKECYERQLKKSPQLSGKIVIRFTIDEEGRVSQALVEENTLQDETVSGCVVSRFQRFRFPKPSGGAVTVSYPFIFTPSL